MNLNNLAFAPSGEGPLALWLVVEVRADRAPEMAETSRALSCALRPFPLEFRGRFHGLRPGLCFARRPWLRWCWDVPASVVMSFHRIWIGAGLMIAG